MKQRSRVGEAKHGAALPGRTAEMKHLLALLDEVWPGGPSRRDAANLPRPVYEAFRGERPSRAVTRAIEQLDRTLQLFKGLAGAAGSRPTGMSGR